MTQRYTVKDVREAFRRATLAATSVGIDPSEWVLQEGSAANGHAYRVFRQPVGQSGLWSLDFTDHNGYLGMTAREASDRLMAYASAWWAVPKSE